MYSNYDLGRNPNEKRKRSQLDQAGTYDAVASFAPGVGTGLGAAAGGLIGLIGGPAGAGVGGTIGAALGGALGQGVSAYASDQSRKKADPYREEELRRQGQINAMMSLMSRR